jgi:signal transduction histidine kinase
MPRSPFAKYAVASGLVALVFACRTPIEAWAGGGTSPLLYLPAVTLAAWFGGLGPGLLAIVLGGGLWVYFDIYPVGSFVIPSGGDRFRVAVFAGEGALLSILMEMLHAARRAADEYTVRLKEAQRRALQAERLAAIGQMVTGLAHESRNALQRSQACLEMLAFRLEDRPESLQLVAGVQAAHDDLQRLYEEVRCYAAPLIVERRECQLREVLLDAWGQLEGTRRGRDARLVEGAEAPTRCRVDAPRMVQVFRNLLDNSLAACHDPVVVSVEWSGADLGGLSAIRVAVRDNGPGFSPEQRLHLFEPFYTTKTQGTGLGLAIARRIVEAHGGSIAVGPGDGRGAEVVIILPRGDA